MFATHGVVAFFPTIRVAYCDHCLFRQLLWLGTQPNLPISHNERLGGVLLPSTYAMVGEEEQVSGIACA